MIEFYRFKTIHDLFLQGNTDEAKQMLADMQRRYIVLCDENTSLKMQIEEYEDILYLARNLVFDKDFYWLTTGGIKQGPFCPTCYDRDGLLIRLAGEVFERYCPSCRADYAENLPSQVIASPSYSAKKNMSAESTHHSKVIPFVSR